MCTFAGGNNNIDNMMSSAIYLSIYLSIYLRGRIASDKT